MGEVHSWERKFRGFTAWGRLPTLSVCDTLAAPSGWRDRQVTVPEGGTFAFQTNRKPCGDASGSNSSIFHWSLKFIGVDFVILSFLTHPSPCVILFVVLNSLGGKNPKCVPCSRVPSPHREVEARQGHAFAAPGWGQAGTRPGHRAQSGEPPWPPPGVRTPGVPSGLWSAHVFTHGRPGPS